MTITSQQLLTNINKLYDSVKHSSQRNMNLNQGFLSSMKNLSDKQIELESKKTNIMNELSSLTARETGGPVTKNKPYLVGESGPEVFVPQEKGNIVSNSSLKMSEQLGHTRGVVTDPKEKAQQEAYMLKYVNEERKLQGLKPLKKLSYAQGVELTKMMGPGPKTTETSDTHFDFDNMIKTTSESKTMGDKSIMRGSIGMLTEKDKEEYFAANPEAKEHLDMMEEFKLDALGADISASAKMNQNVSAQKNNNNNIGQLNTNMGGEQQILLQRVIKTNTITRNVGSNQNTTVPIPVPVANQIKSIASKLS